MRETHKRRGVREKENVIRIMYGKKYIWITRELNENDKRYTVYRTKMKGIIRKMCQRNRNERQVKKKTKTKTKWWSKLSDFAVLQKSIRFIYLLFYFIDRFFFVQIDSGNSESG